MPVFCCRDFRRAPIHLAALKGQTSCIEVLFTHRADVNAQDKCVRFCPYFMIAMMTIMKMMITNDDQDDQVHDYHDTCIWRCCLALNGQRIHVCEMELGVCFHVCHCRMNRTPIHLAALEGHTSCIEVLFTMEASVNIQDE